MRTSVEILKEQQFEIGEPVEFAIKQGKDTGIVSAVIITPDCLLMKLFGAIKIQKNIMVLN